MKNDSFIGIILLSNGVVDLCAAALFLIVPMAGLPFPGFESFDTQSAYLAAGWGAGVLSFGIFRLWAWRKKEFYTPLLAFGIFEAGILFVVNLVHLFFTSTSFAQVQGSVFISAGFGLLYLIATLRRKAK